MQAQLEAELRRAADAEEARQIARREAQEECDRVERARIAAEEAAVAEAERQAALVARLEAIKPDREKALAYIDALLAVPHPGLRDHEMSVLLTELEHALQTFRGEVEGLI
jgi:hypothetical protein